MTSVPRKRHDAEEEEYELTPEQEAEIEESIAELERGEGIPAAEVLREMREGLYGSS
jgi:hypothetical protein